MSSSLIGFSDRLIIASAANFSNTCEYVVTRETFPLIFQAWKEGGIQEQGSTRDTE